jgi:predicted hydrolase (HD superfamily)
MLPTREEAFILLNQHVKEPYQILHAKMIANAMESYSPENEKDLWYITGLLHDLDYYEHPEEHPKVSLKWFKEWGYPEELIHAVEAHAHGYHGITTEPKTPIASCLCACDELSGLIYAYSLMRPGKFDGMEVKSIQKRFKDKSFAKKINREEVMYGVEKFGITFEEHIQNLINVFSKMEELK